MAWFQKAPPEPLPKGPVDAGFEPYARVWERKTPPDPGANVYAWETLQQEQYSPIGRGIRVRAPTQVIGEQVYLPGMSVWLAGVPTVSGGMIGQPLYDPQSGYTAPIPGAFPANVALNIATSLPSLGAVMKNNSPNPDKLGRGL